MLETAGRLFAANGFHAASMDEIADAAGISKPMLYNYFGSKEGLYFAFIEQAYRDFISSLDAAVQETAAAGGGPAVQLRNGLRAYYRFVGEHRDAFRVVFRELGDPGGRLTQPRQRLRRRIAAAIRGIVADEGSSSDPPADADALAEVYLWAARGMADLWLDQPGRTAEDVADQLWQLIMGGLRDLGPPLG